MATVYLAEDLRHGRRVAIKVLRPELAAALGPERFLREITLTAQLDHPHILSLLDSGEVLIPPLSDAEGGTGGRLVLYYVMPYVEGETLRDRLNREKQLPLEDALQITREVADALGYAHSRGIVHRDIKPENILLAGEHARVVDFGIARALTEAGRERLTQTGLAIGTPAYMSPEQASGAQTIDGRSDLYALGCVLYEMLLGHPPFTGTTAQQTLARHALDPVPPLRTVRGAVPAGIEATVLKVLSKTPADRFATASQFTEALARQPASKPRDHRPRTAALLALPVLLAALGVSILRSETGPTMQNPAYTILADVDGNADAEVRRAVKGLVRAGLEQASVLMPVSEAEIRAGLAGMLRSDTLALDAEAARELAYRGAVRTVVATSLDQIGGSLALTVRVLDADNGSVIATERATSDSEDGLIPATDDAVRALHRRLGVRRVELQAARPLVEATTPSFDAFRKLSQAEELFWRASGGPVEERTASAIELLREAVAIDSALTRAWATKAHIWGDRGQRDSQLVALEHLERHLDRGSERERLRNAATVAYARGDWPLALRLNDRLVREYASPEALHTRGFVLAILGRREEALEDIRRALEEARFGPSRPTQANYVRTLIVQERAGEARAFLDSIGADWPMARAAIMVATGEWSAAESLFAGHEAQGTGLQDPHGFLTLAGAAARRGEVGTAEDWVGRAARAVQDATTYTTEVAAAELLMTLVAGRPWPRPPVFGRAGLPDGEAWTGIWQAVSGDTTAARATADDVRNALPVRYRGAAPEFIEALIAARAARWNEVIDLLSPVVAEGETGRRLYDGWVTPFPARWLLATAYEHSGRLDEAVTTFERVLAADMVPDYLVMRGVPYSFAQQRLVVLHARLGRLEDAARHWEIFRNAFTNPDPEYRHLIDAAREALEQVERQRG